MGQLTVAVTFALLTTAVFLIDANTRLGANIPLLYILPVLITVWHAPRAGVAAATLCTILAITRVMWFPSGDLLLGIVNRALTVLALWTMAVLLLHFKRAEARLREQEELVRTGEMAMTIAHELRNALAGIRAAVDVFGASLGTSDRHREVRREIANRVDSLEGFVVDLLTLSRPMPVALTPQALMPAVQRAAASLATSPGFGAVSVDAPAIEAMVPMDAPLLEAALLHLLRNAAEAMDGTGRITISAALGRGVCQISIRDTGGGIPAEIRHRVFEPFFTTRSRSRGLGLAIATRIIKHHRGSLAIESEAGMGTTAIVTLPLAS
jgi:signal transduction histidine kinase